jgi:deazaflavin-dependent oxidoreductase (nitroreductase family)
MTDPRPPSAFPPIDISLLGDDHVRLYRETNGEQGHIWNGAPTLLLTTKGRKSGEARTIPIIYTPYGDSYVIIASKGGSPTHPLWYLNVLEDSHVEVQVKAERFHAAARTAKPPERERIWAEAIKTWPRYDEYQSRTSRLIPVVVLDPSHSQPRT